MSAFFGPELSPIEPLFFRRRNFGLNEVYVLDDGLWASLSKAHSVVEKMVILAGQKFQKSSRVPEPKGLVEARGARSMTSSYPRSKIWGKVMIAGQIRSPTHE